MEDSPDSEVVDGATFELRPHHRTPIRKKWVCLRKNRAFTDRYLALADEFKAARIVELGVDQGGSTSFFTKLFKPEKLLALELSAEPVEKVLAFLAEHDPQGHTEIHWGVDQADRTALPALIEKVFKQQALDLVVDDASHMLAPSTTSFEMLFPKVRPGGLYILEDWSGDNLLDRSMHEALAKDADGSLAETLQSLIDVHPYRTSPMSVLICQLVMACGSNPNWISEVRATDGFCEVRRGPAEIPDNTPVASYIGPLGSWVFQDHMVSD